MNMEGPQQNSNEKNETNVPPIESGKLMTPEEGSLAQFYTEYLSLTEQLSTARNETEKARLLNQIDRIKKGMAVKNDNLMAKNKQDDINTYEIPDEDIEGLQNAA